MCARERKGEESVDMRERGREERKGGRHRDTERKAPKAPVFA